MEVSERVRDIGGPSVVYKESALYVGRRSIGMRAPAAVTTM